MAKVIEFYVPTSFHQKVKWTSSPVRNEVIELCPHDEGETKIIAVFEEVVRVEQYLVLKRRGVDSSRPSNARQPSVDVFQYQGQRRFDMAPSIPQSHATSAGTIHESA